MLEKLKLWIITHKTEALLGGAALATLAFMQMKTAPKRRARRKTKITVKPKAVRRSYNKAPAGKKAWQVKGSEAARRRMAKLRRMKRK